MSRLSGAILVLVVLSASSCFPPSVRSPERVVPTTRPPTSSVGLPNPAAVFCEQHGFRIEMRADATGAQSGVCRFPDGSECDEWAYYRGECGPASSASITATPEPTATRPGSLTESSAPPVMPSAIDAETYTSGALGIRFSYLPKQNGQIIKVLEQGDKIYVYPDNMKPTVGQWVQVFEKQPDENLVDAIKRVIMPGHPAEDCRVVPVTHPVGSSAQSPNYEYAGITVRRGPGEDDAAVLPRWRTCPQPYTVVGGIGYFQADSHCPSKFLFVSIGQYAILAGKDVPWQETIESE